MTLTTRLAIAMITLVAIAVSAVGWLGYRDLEQDLLQRILDRTETHSRLVAFDLESHTRGTSGDIAGFLAAPALNGLIRARAAGGMDPVDGPSEQTWRDRIATRLVAELQAKPQYAQFRIIGVDDGGRELLRIDRSGPNGAVRLVPEAELQQKGDRPYFRKTIALPAGEIHVSPLDLSQEHGAVETPHVPTLHVAAPLHRPDGKPFGVIVINVDMRPAFDRVRTAVRQGGAIYAVGSRGDYFVHPDRSLEFGSDLGRPTDWRKDFPDFAGLLGSTGSVARTIPDAAGRPDGAAFAPAILSASEWVGIIETVPNAIIIGPAEQIRNTAIKVGFVAVLLAAALALLIARSLTRPIVQLTRAVESIGHGGTAEIPTGATGETGVLARAFARTIAESREKTAALEREVAERRHTEAARDHHAERESLFSAAFESSNDAIITMSLDGTITGWNSAAQRLYLYSAAEAVGNKIDLIIPADRHSEIEDTLRRIGWGEKIEHNETVRRRKDGSLVEVSLSISPIKAPSGATIGISKVARDITETNRTRLALRQQTEERRRIFETSKDLILVMNSRGYLVQISPSCEAILGYRPDEMIGRSGEDFIHPDHLETSRTEMRLVRREQAGISDTRCIHKDGRAVWLSWTGTWSDPAKRYFFVGRDMTESRQAQEALREREQLAHDIIDTALDAFMQVDQRGIIRDWNPQAEIIFGWKREEAIGKNVFQLAAPNPKQGPLQNDLQRFLLSGESQVLQRRREIVARRRNGEEFTAELSITALKTRGGFLFNGFLRDLTEKIAAEERIKHGEKMEAIGQLTGGIAHDFNNILTVITGTIEILAAAVADKPQLAAITAMIDDAASRGAELTQQLLSFARKQPLQPRETDINMLVIDTAKLLRPTLGEQIEIESVLAEEACVAVVDPNQLATALINLALNARDAMPNGGKLIFETDFAVLDDDYARSNEDVRPGRYAMIAVSDTGVGIASDILDRVFDPFFTSKGPGKGTGLGLSMVYGFIKQSAGHIKIYSEQGYGTTIRMYLPPGTGTGAVAAEPPASALQGGHETILVVEDDKLVRDYVLTQLHSLGYVTLDAANAAEALALVEAGRSFDLLFTDIIMPGTMNGRELADEIERRRPGSKVLYTSGYTENAIIHHGRLDTGVLLLAKPYRKSDLAAMIRKALGS